MGSCADQGFEQGNETQQAAAGGEGGDEFILRCGRGKVTDAGLKIRGPGLKDCDLLSLPADICFQQVAGVRELFSNQGCGRIGGLDYRGHEISLKNLLVLLKVPFVGHLLQSDLELLVELTQDRAAVRL